MDNELSFYQRLMVLLNALDWTKKKLSEQTGITEKTLSGWGRKPFDFIPRKSNIYKIIDATKCTPDWLLSGKGEMLCCNKQVETKEPEKQLLRHYRNLARLDEDILEEIKTWIDETEKFSPGFRGWFRIEFQNRFPEFDEWKSMTIKKQREDMDDNRVANG